MDLLTGREFSRRELELKLKRKFESCLEIGEELDRLQRERLQSDERFTESFVRSRVIRGQGPARIRRDAREKGIEAPLFDQVLEIQDIDWYALAKDVAVRKFGSELAVDSKDRAKRMRFMQYRGFSFDQINYALSDNEHNE